MNAKLLLQNGKVEKANIVLSKAMELLHRTENAVGVIPVHLLPIRASLLYLYGVTTLLCNKDSSGDVSVDCNWFSKTRMKSVYSVNTIDMTDSMQGEEAELEVPRRGSSRRCRASKTVETSVGDNGKKKSSRAKGRGKNKKVEELLQNVMNLMQMSSRNQRDEAKDQSHPRLLTLVMLKMIMSKLLNGLIKPSSTSMKHFNSVKNVHLQLYSPPSAKDWHSVMDDQHLNCQCTT
ncbi:hypothetical protein OS493_010846 [Desmophyllum pertusum]|uniref:Uncharacterized protein n=1 Tax=Desmophyllum pertusum TaxID=174260 RepID=A0A9W9ZEU2_9CNID|nr:hypothetical protein OS493_010846 [Desmophyllum pertusum]